MRGRNGIVRILVVALAAFAPILGGTAFAQTPVSSDASHAGSPAGAAVVPRSLDVPGGSLVAPGKAPELDLLYTGDVIGYIEPCG